MQIWHLLTPDFRINNSVHFPPHVNPYSLISNKRVVYKHTERNGYINKKIVINGREDFFFLIRINGHVRILER